MNISNLVKQYTIESTVMSKSVYKMMTRMKKKIYITYNDTRENPVSLTDMENAKQESR